MCLYESIAEMRCDICRAKSHRRIVKLFKVYCRCINATKLAPAFQICDNSGAHCLTRALQCELDWDGLLPAFQIMPHLAISMNISSHFFQVSRLLQHLSVVQDNLIPSEKYS
jgi:hypothetical protein